MMEIENDNDEEVYNVDIGQVVDAIPKPES